jgi:hypothetical protein
MLKETWQMTKAEFDTVKADLKSEWFKFFIESKKGKDLSDEIVEKYPLQSAAWLRESLESGGLGYANTAYLARNKKKSTKMKAIVEKYKLDLKYANIMFSREGYHFSEVKYALLEGKKIAEQVLKDYPELS